MSRKISSGRSQITRLVSELFLKTVFENCNFQKRGALWAIIKGSSENPFVIPPFSP